MKTKQIKIIDFLYALWVFVLAVALIGVAMIFTLAIPIEGALCR